MTTPDDPKKVDTELADLGFRKPPTERGFQIPFHRGGAESRRRGRVLLVVAAGWVAIAVLLLGLGCQNSCSVTGGWVVPLALLVLVLLAITLAVQFWFIGAVPATFESARRADLAPGQFEPAQTAFPSRSALFDPEYGHRRERN